MIIDWVPNTVQQTRYVFVYWLEIITLSCKVSIIVHNCLLNSDEHLAYFELWFLTRNNSPGVTGRCIVLDMFFKATVSSFWKGLIFCSSKMSLWVNRTTSSDSSNECRGRKNGPVSCNHPSGRNQHPGTDVAPPDFDHHHPRMLLATGHLITADNARLEGVATFGILKNVRIFTSFVSLLKTVYYASTRC